MKYFVYILGSEKMPKTYVGSTENIEKRLEYHNKGKVSFTSRFLPWKIIYTEELTSKEDALKREKYYKSASGRRKVKIILKDRGYIYI